MYKWIRNLGVGTMVMAMAFSSLSGVSHATNNVDEISYASQAYAKMNTQSQQQFVAGISTIDLSNMDIETALMMVQQQRTQLLEKQLESQIKEVQKRNEAIAALNLQLNEANAELEALKKAKATTEMIQEKEAIIQQLKNKIDAQSNSQQMDMLRLQSLSNKRNEAFDIMQNFIKKMQLNRSSIIGNMR